MPSSHAEKPVLRCVRRRPCHSKNALCGPPTAAHCLATADMLIEYNFPTPLAGPTVRLALDTRFIEPHVDRFVIAKLLYLAVFVNATTAGEVRYRCGSPRRRRPRRDLRAGVVAGVTADPPGDLGQRVMVGVGRSLSGRIPFSRSDVSPFGGTPPTSGNVRRPAIGRGGASYIR